LVQAPAKKKAAPKKKAAAPKKVRRPGLPAVAGQLRAPEVLGDPACPTGSQSLS
jgi:hypothetical protein